MQTLKITKFKPLENVRDIQIKYIVLGGNFNIIFNSNFEKLCWNPISKKKPLPKMILIKQKIFLCDMWHVTNP